MVEESFWPISSLFKALAIKYHLFCCLLNPAQQFILYMDMIPAILFDSMQDGVSFLIMRKLVDSQAPFFEEEVYLNSVINTFLADEQINK